MKLHNFLSLFLILSLINSSSGLTRIESIEDFLDNTRVTENGFANTKNDDITIFHTSLALEIGFLLGFNINQTNKILLFYQNSHNSDGGFGNIEFQNSSFEYTISAINGLKFLNVNSSQLIKWKIFEYLNQSIIESLYLNITSNTLKPFTSDILTTWKEYITSAFVLSRQPTLPILKFIPQLHNLQLSNGSYSDFQTAVRSIYLLSLLNEVPKDVELAKRYILAHLQSNGIFSAQVSSEQNLKDTYEALLALTQISDIFALEFVEDMAKFILKLQVARSGFRSIDGVEPTMLDTWYAIKILSMINRINELQTPDVLQEIGFVEANLLGIIAIPIIMLLRRKDKW